jgi:hypothetical protein
MYLQAVLSTAQGSPSSFSDSTVRSINRRRSKRRSLALSASATLPQAGDIPVLIRDISPGGLLLEAGAGMLRMDDEVTIDLPDDTKIRSRVAWTSERFFGCEFDSPISAAGISAALLRGKTLPRAAAAPGRPLPNPGIRSGALEPESDLSVALVIGFLLWAGAGGVLALIL